MGQLVLLPKVSDLRKVESFVKTRHTLLVDWQTKSEQLVRQDRLAEHGQPILETLKGDGHAIITMEAFQDKASEHDAEALPPLSAPTNYPRLSTPAVIRIPGAVVIGFGIGAFLGAAHGGKMAALRFRAENAHRLPTSTKGWYLYHKSKNYHAMLQGLREAGKMGSKIGFWVGGFFYLENMIDMSRGGRKDFLSTTLSGLTVAGTFSAWNRLPLATAARIARTGLVSGVIFGLAQDALFLARGRRLAYVDFILGRPRQRDDLYLESETR